MFVSNLCPSIIRLNEHNFKLFFTILDAFMFIFGAIIGANPPNSEHITNIKSLFYV